MTTRFAAVLVRTVVALAARGCATGPAIAAQPYEGELPPDTRVDLGGSFSFSQDGELRLALAQPCTATRRFQNGTFVRTSCDRERLDAIRLVAVTPWRREVRGVWIDASQVAFRLDWKASGLDPQAGDAATLAAQPWAISLLRWRAMPSLRARSA